MAVPSKYQNDIDLNKVFNEAKKYSALINTHINQSKDLKQNIDKLFKNKQVVCLIYATTITFRVGKSSVKGLKGHSSGYKISGKNSKSLLIPLKVPSKNTKTLSKENEVILTACYFLLNDRKRVKTESDSTEKVETEQVLKVQNDLKKIIKEYGTIRLQVGDAIYDVDNFSQVTAGRPKADMIFSYKGTPVIFVSHKKGKKPADFQQYGGFVADLGIKSLNDTKKYPGIYKFMLEVNHVLNTLGVSKTNGLHDLKNTKSGFIMADFVKDERVVYITKFGKDFYTKRMGLNNCSILIDGDILFKPVKGKGANTFLLDGSFHSESNPELLKTKKRYKPDPNSKYSSVFFITRSTAQGLKQVNFYNARTVIWPNNDVASGYMTKYKEIKNAVYSKNKTRIKQIQQKYEIK